MTGREFMDEVKLRAEGRGLECFQYMGDETIITILRKPDQSICWSHSGLVKGIDEDLPRYVIEDHMPGLEWHRTTGHLFQAIGDNNGYRNLNRLIAEARKELL
jgi:hypothetical protein